jgi:hypothetical protein
MLLTSAQDWLQPRYIRVKVEPRQKYRQYGNMPAIAQSTFYDDPRRLNRTAAVRAAAARTDRESRDSSSLSVPSEAVDLVERPRTSNRKPFDEVVLAPAGGTRRACLRLPSRRISLSLFDFARIIVAAPIRPASKAHPRSWFGLCSPGASASPGIARLDDSHYGCPIRA